MTSLGDRMKRYEAAHRHLLPPRTYTVIRVDGRAFHSYLRNAQKPYDYDFMADMDVVASKLCEEISGAVFAYAQSDEISVLVTDFGNRETQPWFGGVVAKQVSISAALATAVLNARRPGGQALFDSRVFSLPNSVEVANYFIWRQRDAVRNSITMAAQAKFSHRELHLVNTSQMQEMLWQQHGINWNDYPDGVKRGRVVRRETGEFPLSYVDKRTKEAVNTTAVRSWWVANPAPHFALREDGSDWLSEIIPPMDQIVRPDTP